MEEIIREHLQRQDSLKECLALYDGKSAVFFDDTPKADDEKWQQTEGTYSLTLYLDRKRDPKRVGAGTLTAQIRRPGQGEAKISLRTVEKALTKILDGYIFTSADETMEIDFRCNRTWPRDFWQDADETVNTVIFSVTDFPKNVSRPDSAEYILRQWSKTELPQILGKEIHLIGDEPAGTVFQPSAETPALYWRTGRMKPGGMIADRKTVAFRAVSLQGHILTGTAAGAAAEIAERIDSALCGLCRLEGESNILFIDRNSRADLLADPLRTGQLTIETICPVPAAGRPAEKMKHVGFDMK